MLVFWGSFAYDMYADRFLICGGGKEEPVLKKLSVCVLFGGVSSEHEVSLRSAESVLNRLDKDKYHIFPVGITKDGDWILFGGKDYGMLPPERGRTARITAAQRFPPCADRGF